jgi:hypothetical protein
MNLKLSGIALGVALAFASVAQAQDRKAHNDAEQRIEAQAKADRAKCDPLKGNAKDICQAEAKGKEKVAKAENDAAHAKDRIKAEEKVKEAKAEATYEVAKQRCDDQKGEAKDACQKQAKVERDRAIGKAEKQADAKRENRAATGGTAPATAPAPEKRKP